MRTILLAILALNMFTLAARDYKVSSPDGKTVVTIKLGKEIQWSAAYDYREIISSVKTGIELKNGKILGVDESVRKSNLTKVDEILKPEIPYKKSETENNYTALLISFKSGFSLQFRVYNDGIAYRYETSFNDTIEVKNEIAGIQFPAGTNSWYPLEKGFMSHNENTFIFSSLDTINSKHLASLPVLFQSNGTNILLTESDIEDYPGMWVRGAGNDKISGVWPAYPAADSSLNDRNVKVTRTRDYIARTAGTRSFPWRVFIIGEKDGNLIENDLVYKLAAPCRLKEISWIKPGKVAWDWWNANNIYGVDFKSGINTETYKYYIDFASRNGIEYVILDEGWYKLGNVLDVTRGIDIPELCRYASEKKVGIILWVIWKTFYDQMDIALDQYEKWGVKGVKVDFMQRDDQKIVNFYWESTRKAAEHHMLIDFHGAYKPDGLGRTYPNAITREGVKGMEHDKWSRDISPDHDLTLPFTRMVAGPMDYTPGAMVNYDSASFSPEFNRPSSQGTRSHQMALYVVFESPLQMLADSPSNYMREQECTDFIVKVPVIWDNIKVLDAKVGDYLLLARRSGIEWYVAGLTDWKERDMELDLSFLGSGEYQMEVFADGINADRYASDYKHSKVNVKPDLKMKIHLAPGGGWVARIRPKE